MNVHELNDDQMNQLKENMLTEWMDAKNESPSLGELLKCHATISDDEVYDKYDGYTFSEDDFSN